MIPQLQSMSPRAKGAAVAATVLVALAVWIGWQQCASATPDATTTAAAPTSQATVLVDAGTDAPLVTTSTTPIKTTAEIVFSTVPSSARATVTWGKKKLGRIEPGRPLVVVRPRDSGPLDVIVRAEGYLPVHTRAYTFSDTRLSVKLTRPDAQSTLLGYRVPLDAGLPITPDGLPVTPDGLTEPEIPPAAETFFP